MGRIILLILIFIIIILLSVAFLTLLERNLLGYSQLRKSPNKSGLLGIIQPLYDGLKLLTKQVIKPYNSWRLFYYFSPLCIFIVLFVEWMVMPYELGRLRFLNRVLFFLCLTGLLVYFILFTGLFRVRKYGVLGSLRRRGQRVSFELTFFFIAFCLMCVVLGFEFKFFNLWAIHPLLVPLFFVIVLVELGRAPFDFPESERELVSGYNIEYSRGLFVLLFLREYGFMVFFGVLIGTIFFNGRLSIQFLFITIILMLRRVFPRTKYDQLMGVFWFNILPLIMWIFIWTYLILKSISI